MIRRRLWPALLLPAAIPVAVAGFVAVLLLLLVPAPQPSATDGAGLALPDAAVAVTLDMPRAEAVIAADPFAGDRKAPPRRSRSEGPGRPGAIGARPSAGSVRLALVGVIETAQGPLAMLRDQTTGETAVVRVGESFHGFTLEQAAGTAARLKTPSGEELVLALSFREASAEGRGNWPASSAATPLRRPVRRPSQADIVDEVEPDTMAGPAMRGAPRPARRFRARARDVRSWQQKLEDYGIAGSSTRPAPAGVDAPPEEPPAAEETPQE